MPSDAENLNGIKSIEVGVRLLIALTSARGPLPLSDLGKLARMTPSKAHRYLSSFANVGLVEQDAATREYRLGPFAFEMGLAAIGSSDQLNDAVQTQIALRDELDQTVVLSVWGTHGPTVLRIEESSHPVIMTMKVGAALPMMHTAAGRIFAAYMPRKIIESYLQATNFSAAVYGHRGAVRYSDIAAELREIYSAGFVVSNGELLQGVNATAAPLLSPQGQLVGALAVIGQQNSLDMSSEGHITRALLRATSAYERSAVMSPVRNSHSQKSTKPCAREPDRLAGGGRTRRDEAKRQ